MTRPVPTPDEINDRRRRQYPTVQRRGDPPRPEPEPEALPLHDRAVALPVSSLVRRPEPARY